MILAPEDPRMCVVFIQTHEGVTRAYVVMDFRRRALRRRRPAGFRTWWRSLYPSEAVRLFSV